MEVPQIWTLSVDDSLNLGSNVRLVMKGPSNILIVQSLRFGFKVSNSHVEYDAFRWNEFNHIYRHFQSQSSE